MTERYETYTPLEIRSLDDYKIPQLPECPRCGSLIITPYHWHRAGVQERQDMLDDGFVRAHRDSDLCFRCEPPAQNATKLAGNKRGYPLELWKEMSVQGHSVQEVADMLGIKRKTMQRVISDARKRGDL